MDSINNNEGKKSEKHEELKLEDLNHFVEHMEKILDELEEKIRVLPKVDKKGQSECSFAEELYAYKEEMYAIAKKEAKKIGPYMELGEQEIERCRRNIEQLRVDTDSLNLEEAKKKYEAAKESIEYQMNKAVNQNRMLIKTGERFQELSKQAEEKVWPLGKPKRSGDRTDPKAVLAAVLDGRFDFRSPHNPLSRGSGPSAKTEIDNLLSLGPLG